MIITCVALMRGINVGGKNKIAMQSLRELFVEAGCKDVQTYIQSGNVVFQADPDILPELPRIITALIVERIGFRSPVVLRTVEQWRDTVLNNPYLKAGVAEDKLHVLFLADVPSAAQIASLAPNRSAPDEFIVHGQEVYLHIPNSVADTKLTNAYFDSKLSTVSTGRNWRTVTKLLAMMESL